MAVPGKNSRDFPVRVTKDGGAAIDAEAAALKVDKVELIRMALREYFEKRGQFIQFTPEKPGGRQRRMTEQQAIDRVQRRVRALGLPPAQVEFKVRHKTYDLAWPDQRVAVEVSMRKRPADSNDWTVAHIKPTMSDGKIDEALRQLPLQPA